MNTEKTLNEKQGNAVYNVLAAAFVLSGKCRIGDVGEETKLEDITGEKLYVGDIVITSTIDEMGVCNNNGLTVVCSDKWTSYSDGTHKAKPNYEHFVMGIKNVDFMGKDRDKWMVKRVKSHKDVIVGEKWKDFGFSYVAD